MACRGGGSNPPPDSRGRPSFDFLVRSEFYARTDTIDRLVAVQRKDDPLVAPIGRRLVAQVIGAADVGPQLVGPALADAEVEPAGGADGGQERTSAVEGREGSWRL